MRILVGADVPCDPNAGAAGTVYHTSRALRELGHQVDEIWEDDLGRRIGHGNLHYLLELPRRYRKAVGRKCAETEYDVIQLSQPHAHLAARDHQRRRRPGVFVNRSHGVEPRVEQAVRECRVRLGLRENRSPQSLLSPILRRWIARHWPAAAQNSDGVIVPCEDDREYLISRLGVEPGKVRTIHHGVPEAFLRRNAAPPGEERLRGMLHVAQLAPFKGPHILARVVNETLARHRDLTFTWVCSASHHDRARALFTPRVVGRVRLLDWMPQDDLIAVYDRHGIFLFPSLAEGAAKASLEAMSRGLCVVASNNSGMKDYITHEESGLLAPAGDVRAFVAHVDRLLDEKELSCRLSEGARAAAGSYSWKRCAEKATEFYEELLARKHGRRLRVCLSDHRPHAAGENSGT